MNTMENSMKIPQNPTTQFSNSTSRYISKGNEIRISEIYLHFVFIAMLFTKAKMCYNYLIKGFINFHWCVCFLCLNFKYSG